MQYIKSIAKLIETGTLHKYAKLRHAISIFGEGNCFTLEDVIMSLCNSNCSQVLLRSPKSPRKIGNNAYSIRPDKYIVFPLYCMRCSVQADARQGHKLTFRHLQYQQLLTYMWMILILCNGTSEEKYRPSCHCLSPRASDKLDLLSIWSSAKFQRSLWILKRTLANVNFQSLCELSHGLRAVVWANMAHSYEVHNSLAFFCND